MQLLLLNWSIDFLHLLFFTKDSSTIHLSKCRPAISEDETIIEDSSVITKSNANTIQRNPLLHSQKVATILRHRSYRDREILSEFFCFKFNIFWIDNHFFKYHKIKHKSL